MYYYSMVQYSEPCVQNWREVAEDKGDKMRLEQEMDEENKSNDCYNIPASVEALVVKETVFLSSYETQICVNNGISVKYSEQ